MTIKEQLKGTCVLNESREMGAEIVALYTEAGIYNGEFNYAGKIVGYYYGEKDGAIRFSPSESTFTKVLTLSKLREIVSTPEEKGEPCLQVSKAIAEMGQVIDLVLKTRDKILEQKERFKALKESSIDSVKASVENIVSQSEEPRFKAGDVVEVEGLEYMPEFVHSFDNVAWVKTSGQNFGQLVPLNKLSHPKDKLREKVEEMLNGSFRYQSIDKRRWIVEEDVKEMLTEAIKWGQENK